MRFDNNWEYPKFHTNNITKWHWVATYRENLKLGKNTDIGAFCFLQCEFGLTIEDEVQIGGGVFIYTKDTIGNNNGPVTLLKNCKIGANSVVMPNVLIGRNAIIGACSFVKAGTVVPNNEIWAGNPARKIKRVR